MEPERVIGIHGLEIHACVGVPDEERNAPQRLLLDLSFAGVDQPPALDDDITRTVDYYEVSRRVEQIAGEKPRRLIETMAEEIASRLLKEFRLRWIQITVRKFILPNTDWVSVSIRREADGEKPESRT